MKEKIFGYLFVHFTGENTENGEQIYFALSQDGLHYQDLNQGNPVLVSEVSEKGLRDPFIIRREDDEIQKLLLEKGENEIVGKYILVATDLRIKTGKGWQIAQYEGSRNLVIYKSDDLIHYTEPVLLEIGVEEAGCVWAPEIIYDEERKEYLIFFASMVPKDEPSAKQIIYAVTTKDFIHYSEATRYIERSTHVIDTTMIKVGDYYYRFSKNEETKFVNMDRAQDLHGAFEEVYSETLDGLYGVEGPEIYPLKEDGKFCLIVDQFATGKGYLPMITEDIASGKFRILEEGEYDLGVSRKRHGGVLPLTEIEYSSLEQYWK